MDPRFSEKVYPRRDNAYKAKKSLDFDIMRTKVYVERPKDTATYFMEWVAYTLVGVFTGFTAAIMTNIEEHTTSFRRNGADDMIGASKDKIMEGWMFFTGFSALLVLISTCMTIFWGPGANGSGVAELITYMNGVNYPGTFGFETFVTKTIGVVFAVVGGLCVGKEGPLAHIGANIGVFTLYLPLPKFEFFRNDKNKRHLIAAGTSAGVSAAFGAPIGGALFAYEISKPNTFWKFSVVWKVFFSCAIAVFTLALCNSLLDGEGINRVSSAVLKFGVKPITAPTIETIPSSIFTGVICGLLGAGFIIVNSNLGLLRKKYIASRWLKVVESVFFSVATTSYFFWAPWFFNDCVDNDTVVSDDKDLIVNYDCPEGQFSPLATLFFNTEGAAIRSIISRFDGPGGILVSWPHMLVYFAGWYFFTITTYGCWVPAGLFLPGIIIGCSVGSIYQQIVNDIFDVVPSQMTPEEAENYYATASIPILCAAGAMLSGYCRLTYCLVVIMLETTSSINIFVPMTFGILVARNVGNIFTRSLYARALRMKQMPVLSESCPSKNANMPVYKIMEKNVIYVATICDVASLRRALQSPHHGFPVVNTAGKLVGLVPQTMLVRLLQKKRFYKKERIDRGSIQRKAGDESIEKGFDAPQQRRGSRRASMTAAPGLNASVALISDEDFQESLPKKFDLAYDAENGFPETPKDQILNWNEFNTNVNSDELSANYVLENVVEQYQEEWVDLRPYMIEVPSQVSVYTKMKDVLEMFRMHHLRSLCVVNPNDGSIVGIVTRKDLFAYMGL